MQKKHIIKRNAANKEITTHIRIHFLHTKVLGGTIINTLILSDFFYFIIWLNLQ